MSRVIKFRAWHDGKMMLVRSLHNVHSQVNIRAELCDPDGGLGTGKPAVSSEVVVDNLMQYTGLKDKNGTEIFEGDIVRCDKCDGQVYEIKWFDGKSDFVGQLGWDLIASEAEATEVIGNKYETPELLK
jgi:uncharacterized phage protein (TIGR01671 family)